MAAWLVRALWRVGGRKWSFLGIFLVVFAGSVVTLAHFDLLPNPPSAPAAVAAQAVAVSIAQTLAPITQPEDPMSIQIPAIHLSATITNPTTTSISALDALLLKGAVRYPTSARLGEDGNVVLFGHSSYLPVVKNPAYKTFDDIQKLKVGDLVTVSSAGTAYTYRVRGVAKENAHDAIIPLSVGGRVLTLATCNSFATKDDRFIVTADFVESHLLGA